MEDREKTYQKEYYQENKELLNEKHRKRYREKSENLKKSNTI